VSPSQETQGLNVLLLSSDPNSQVEKALMLDSTFNITKNVPFTNASLFSQGIHLVVITNYPLTSDQAVNLSAHIHAGGKVFMVLGPESKGNGELLKGINPGITITNDTLQGGDSTGINYTTGQENSLLVKNVQWSSCPSVRNHTVVSGLNDSWIVYLNDFNANDHPFLASYSNQNQGTILLFTVWVFGNYAPNGNNYQVELWPYFNYFCYLASQSLASPNPALIPTFSKWPFSPVPHASDTTAIGILVCGLGIVAFVLFFYQRSKSRKTQIILSEKALSEMTKKQKAAAVEEEHEDITNPWEEVGTHRQISGFLFGLFAGILLGIPQIVLTGIVFPRWIMPFPQVAGWFDWIKQFFQAIWMLFDVGTSIALAKYFSQYRIKQPQKAVHYIQIFVWWQLLSGVVQIVIISLVGSIVFPQTNFAHLSWMVVLHSLIQYPGFFVVFQYIFQGMQRTDLQNLSNLLYQAILMLLSQYAWILIFRFAFKDDPLGEAFWSGIGYCIGQYVAEWGIFFIMMGFYKKLGFSVSTLFRVDFTRAEFKEALIFGGKEAMGHVWVPLAYMYQVWILGAFLPNYNEEMGLYGYANMLMQVTALVGFLTEGFLAPVSEAHSHKKQQLLDFTLAQGIKWANFIIFYMIVLLGAIGQPFIVLLAGSNWLGASRFIPLMLVYYLMQPWAWLGDKALAASGYTGRAAIIWIVEQGGKMLLLSILIMFVKDIMIVLWAHIPVL
nr:lipopolysaccharide biosynthesis protein [Candidatus Sigynarchaeota archaeon]